MKTIIGFIKESWQEYIGFYKKSIKNKKRRKWLFLLIVIVEIIIFLVISYEGYKYFIGEN